MGVGAPHDGPAAAGVLGAVLGAVAWALSAQGSFAVPLVDSAAGVASSGAPSLLLLRGCLGAMACASPAAPEAGAAGGGAGASAAGTRGGGGGAGAVTGCVGSSTT